MCDPGKTDLDAIQSRIMAFAEERDWVQFHTPKNLSMAIAAEAGELLEHFLWLTAEESYESVNDASKSVGVREEVADILIFTLQLASVAGINVGDAIRDKLRINADKYPVDRARGNARKYTES